MAAFYFPILLKLGSLPPPSLPPTPPLLPPGNAVFADVVRYKEEVEEKGRRGARTIVGMTLLFEKKEGGRRSVIGKL